MTALQIACLVSGVCAGAAAAAFLLWLGNNLIQTSRFQMEFGGADRQIKIVQISDLHGKSFGARNKRLISAVIKENPDFIAVTGDIIHKYTPKNIKTALETVSALRCVAPVLYVSGNHEMRNKGYRFFRRDLKEAGAEVLDNRTVAICGVTVTGLNGAHNKNGTLKKIAPATPYKILLAHMPQFIKNYSECGYSLVLSGHAHGGQWRLPFIKRGLYSPGQGLFPRYSAGLYTEGGAKMIVSRGLGNSEFPLRLFNRPELVSVTLKPPNPVKNIT